MRFEEPRALLALAAIMPLLLVFLIWAWRKRQRLITQFVQSRLLAILTVGVSKPRQKLRIGCVFAAVGLLLISLARPQWGFGYEEVKQRGLDIIVAIDTSRSMLAEDVAPNRLAKTKLAAIDLRRMAKADRMGIVAFAGSAFLQMPLSIDDDAFRQHLEALDTTIIPQGGSALAEAIQTARSAFKDAKQDNFKVLVLMTDGEDHEGRAVDLAREAGKEGMHIFTVGVGTQNGELLSIRDNKGRIEFVKDEQGNVVKSKLNEALLSEIASAAQGFYIPLSGTKAIETLYERGLAPLPKGEIQAQVLKRYHEQFQWFLAGAILLLLTESLITDRKASASKAAAATSPLRSPSAAAGTTRALLGLLAASAIITLSPSHTLAATSARSAQDHYNAGRFKNALNDYETVLQDKPEDARLQYNAGNSAYRAKKFDTAVQHFSSALATSDPQLQQQAYFNRGNSRFRAGEEAEDPSKTEPLWQQAAADFESALKLKPDDEDAKHNLSIVKQRLEELQKQKPPSDQKNDSDKKDDQKDKDKEKNDQNQDKNQDGSQNDKNKDQDNQDQKDSKDQKSKQDQKDSDSKDKDKNSSQEQADKQKNQDQKSGSDKDQDKKSGEQQKEAQKKEGDQQKPENAAQQGQQGKDGQNAANGSPGQILQMTPQQAIQMLEALKSEERLLPPQIQSTNRQRRHFKDW